MTGWKDVAKIFALYTAIALMLCAWVAAAQYGCTSAAPTAVSR